MRPIITIAMVSIHSIFLFAHRHCDALADTVRAERDGVLARLLELVAELVERNDSLAPVDVYRRDVARAVDGLVLRSVRRRDGHRRVPRRLPVVTVEYRSDDDLVHRVAALVERWGGAVLLVEPLARIRADDVDARLRLIRGCRSRSCQCRYERRGRRRDGDRSWF